MFCSLGALFEKRGYRAVPSPRQPAPGKDAYYRLVQTRVADPEWVFTVLILKILHWSYEIAIHSRVFILDLPTRIDLGNLYYFFLARNWIV
jgi:hypothetical protein